VTLTTDKKTDDVQSAAEEAGVEEVTADETTGTEDAETADEEKPTPGRRRRVLAAAVIVVFVALVAVSGFLGWQLWQDHQVGQAGQQARDAAVSYAQVLTSIDADKVDENFDQVLAGATGEFKDMYSQSSVQLRQLLIDNKAAAHGVVVESAVQSAARDRVVVLLFVDQTVSNSSVPDPRIDRSRIKMTMEKVDGQWRAAKVELP
jgi:Mce-associated membrane protein